MKRQGIKQENTLSAEKKKDPIDMHRRSKLGVFNGRNLNIIVVMILIIMTIVVVVMRLQAGPRLPDQTRNILKSSSASQEELLTACQEARKFFSDLVDKISTSRCHYDEESKWKVENGASPPCYSYRNRYAAYQDLDEAYVSYIKCNRLTDFSKERSAWYMQIRNSREFAPEFMNTLRSQMVELGWKAGIDFYILCHVDVNQTFNTSWIPEEFRSIVIPFTSKDIGNNYTESDLIYGILNPITQPARIPWLNHLVDVWLLSKYPQYDYVWAMEDDVRFSGPINILLDRVESSLPSKKVHFLNFYTIDEGAGTFWPYQNFEERFMRHTNCPARRISREYSILIHQECLVNNRHAILELALPSIANMYNLTAFSYFLPIFHTEGLGIGTRDMNELKNVTNVYTNLPPNNKVFYDQGSFFIQWPWPTPNLYKDWMEKTVATLPITIIHPFKP